MTNRLAAAALSLIATLAAPHALAIDRHAVWHQGREIEVVDRGGWAVFEDDILIGRIDAVLRESQAAGPDGRLAPKANTLGAAAGRWPRGASGLFEVPYVIESDPSGTVPAAVALFNQQLAGFMRAVPRGAETDYVAFTLSATDDSGACSSSVGRIGGRQVIQGSHLCGVGVLVHEIGHAIGMWHEQVHGDAATFVQVRHDAVDPARVANYVASVNRRKATPYDFASLMHYSPTNFSREGLYTLETVPPGIPIGQRAGFSAADLEGIRRLYGEPPAQVTVTTFPVGLTVLVDGAAVTTPATFDWALGSTHVIDVPGNAQVQGAGAYAFGRWNVDTAGDLAARRTITVSPGDGTSAAPTTRPMVSTYVASFVRHKEVRFATSSNPTGLGGSVVANPPPAALPGLAGAYYRERQPFALEGIPGSANARLGGWAGSFSFLVAYTTSYSSPFRGPYAFSESATGAYEYRAHFVDYPFVTVRARAQDGEVLGLRATVTRASGTSSSERLPYSTLAWAGGESGTLSVDAVQTPFSATMRYVFRDWDGAPGATLPVTAPATGQAPRTVTANFSKEFQAFRQVIPSCAGTITLPGDASAWYPQGSNVSVSLATAAGWVLAAWEGSLSGTAPLTAFTVAGHPNVIARLNTVAQPLTVTAVSPATAAAGSAATVAIDGSGFTPQSEVYVNGARIAGAQFVSGGRIVATVSAAEMPASGLAIVTVTNRAGTGACSVSASGSIDLVGTAAVAPQTGWWWNSAESGRGFFIEKRGNNLFMAGYLYEADGRATWFSAQGAMSGSSFTGALLTYRGGQTLTGAYVAPTAGASPGQLTLTFNAADNATLTWPGGTINLTRFPVGGGGPASLAENGWWWDASEPGRGFSIEIQGGSLFMAGFMYDAAGNPVWYFSQGNLTGSGAYNGVWLQTSGGQTLTGAYRAPTTLPAVGSVGLTFSGSRSGTLTLPNGRQLALTRFDF